MAISKKLLNPDERLLISTRQHPKALFGPLLALVLLLALGVFVQVAADSTLLHQVVWVVCAIGIAWFTVRPFLGWLTTVHAFTDRRLITRSGIITRRGHDIPLARVSDVSIEIHLLDRLFGCGSLLIADASTHGLVRLNDIPHVEDTQRTLNELLHDLHIGRGGNEGV
ncbi:PH domain-containing protein [Nocardioides sambongensis]|uniref:PH domain-containing protein n=1 Tax=Nocardioides sambongensis TaxID=2589074 RepID=UPI001128164B|nr:PH domain-containing protein [Nocardioides sambongensis]